MTRGFIESASFASHKCKCDVDSLIRGKLTACGLRRSPPRNSFSLYAEANRRHPEVGASSKSFLQPFQRLMRPASGEKTPFRAPPNGKSGSSSLESFTSARGFIIPPSFDSKWRNRWAKALLGLSSNSVYNVLGFAQFHRPKTVSHQAQMPSERRSSIQWNFCCAIASENSAGGFRCRLAVPVRIGKPEPRHSRINSLLLEVQVPSGFRAAT